MRNCVDNDSLFLQVARDATPVDLSFGGMAKELGPVARYWYRENEKSAWMLLKESELARLETCLDISTIIEIREAIKLKVRQTKMKTSNSGWFGGWFGTGQSDESQTGYEMSQEDRERLHVSYNITNKNLT